MGMRKYQDMAFHVLAIALAISCAASAANPPKIDFNRQVRPILSDKCFVCHGPDAGTRKAKLRLDMREEALKERDGIHPIVPGQPDKSEVITRIFAADESDRMPPAKSMLTLTAEE